MGSFSTVSLCITNACSVVLKELGVKLDFYQYKEHYLGQTDKEIFSKLFADEGHSITSKHLDEIIQ